MYASVSFLLGTEIFKLLGKLYLIRGPIIAAMGVIVVILGATLFDMSYQSVQPIPDTKLVLLEDKEILPGQFVNSTINSSQLQEHNVIIVHTKPLSDFVKLNVIEPNGMTFEKETKDGYLYHIVQKSNQAGSYSIKMTNIGSKPIVIEVVMGEDPFLSKNCDPSYGVKCKVVQISMGMVAIGLIAFIIGILIGVSDFKKERKTRKN